MGYTVSGTSYSIDFDSSIDTLWLDEVGIDGVIDACLENDVYMKEIIFEDYFCDCHIPHLTEVSEMKLGLNNINAVLTRAIEYAEYAELFFAYDAECGYNLVIQYTSFRNHSEECPKCVFFYDEDGDYTVDEVDSLFHSMVLSHGLATGFNGEFFNEGISVEEGRIRLQTLVRNSGEWQICCSHKSQPIGDYGVYVMGTNDYVANVDLCSELNSKGHRVFDVDTSRGKSLITDREDYSLEKWDHTEHIVCKYKVVGVWIKEWAKSEPGLEDMLLSFVEAYNVDIAPELNIKPIKLYVTGTR